MLVLNTLPFGIGVAASARVGNLIGARSAIGAKHAGHAAALLSVVVGTVVMVVMIATKDVCAELFSFSCENSMCQSFLIKNFLFPQVFGYLFSDDQAVVKLVSEVMPLVASFQVSAPGSRVFQSINLT